MFGGLPEDLHAGLQRALDAIYQNLIAGGTLPAPPAPGVRGRPAAGERVVCYGMFGRAGMVSSGFPADGDDADEGVRAMVAGFRSRLITRAIASTVATP